MPGIVGLITRNPRRWAEPRILRMVEALRHEAFYTGGAWIDEDLGIYVGWMARENSFCAEMPIRNEQGNIVLVFSGEDYAEPYLKQQLKARGHEFANGDSSYLVHVYEDDASFPKNLNGRFHGLLIDRERQSAILFNDRFGLQRIFCHEAADAFYFSAEAKAILEVCPEQRSLDGRSMGEFIACGCVLENRTLFRGVCALPPGSAWRFRAGRLEKKALYFEPSEFEEQPPLAGHMYYAQLRDTFARNLPRYFTGRERVAISLTGGLDTRIIMAWRKAEPGSVPCYTFGSMYRENEDVRLARRVAELSGQPFQVITAGQDFLARFSHYAERAVYLTDGCVDTSRSADLYLNERARQIAPVRVVGTFGSEIIRGAVMFKPQEPAGSIYQPEVLSRVAEAADTYRDYARGQRATLVAFRQPAAYNFGVLMLEQTQVTLRMPYLDNDVVRTIFRAPQQNGNEDVRLRLISDGSPALARLRTDRGLAGSPNGLLGALRRGYLGFTFKAEYAYDYGMPQLVARIDHALGALHLERLWLGRHKVFHYRWWYRTVLANYLREVLLDSRSLARPYINRSGVEGVVNGHTAGTHNYTNEIHRLLSLELIQRAFVDSR